MKTRNILRVLRIILMVLPEHPSDTLSIHNEDGNPARANIKQALRFPDGSNCRSERCQFITPCSYSKSKDIMKAEVPVSMLSQL
ncbi:hypothetical protein Tco_0472245 [Tanacetum coccineum]